MTCAFMTGRICMLSRKPAYHNHLLSILSSYLANEGFALQTKCCLLTLDFATDGYTCDLFSVILTVLR